MTEPPPLNVKKALVALTGQIPVNAPPPAWTINIIATYYMILGEAFDAHPLYFFCPCTLILYTISYHLAFLCKRYNCTLLQAGTLSKIVTDHIKTHF